MSISSKIQLSILTAAIFFNAAILQAGLTIKRPRPRPVSAAQMIATYACEPKCTYQSIKFGSDAMGNPLWTSTQILKCLQSGSQYVACDFSIVGHIWLNGQFLKANCVDVINISCGTGRAMEAYIGLDDGWAHGQYYVQFDIYGCACNGTCKTTISSLGVDCNL
jgi:hypothetical protein